MSDDTDVVIVATEPPPIKSKEMVLSVVFSEILVMGLAVFAPAHDFELGVVASVKLVLLLVPGHGQPVTLILLADANDTPFAVVATADIGKSP
mgnify:CR=1 FL=1